MPVESGCTIPLHRHSCHLASKSYSCLHTWGTWRWCWPHRSLYWNKTKQKKSVVYCEEIVGKHLIMVNEIGIIKGDVRLIFWHINWWDWVQAHWGSFWNNWKHQQGPTLLGWSPWWKAHRGRQRGRLEQQGSAYLYTSLTRQNTARSSLRSTAYEINKWQKKNKQEKHSLGLSTFSQRLLILINIKLQIYCCSVLVHNALTDVIQLVQNIYKYTEIFVFILVPYVFEKL